MDLWSRESGSFFLLQRVSCEGCGLAPLYILQVPLAGPHTTSEAQEFFRMYHSYSEITNPSDRMRWCRYSLGLLQKDVAAMVGMEEWLYRDLESGAFHRSFTPELSDKLAALYGIPVEDILDDYTLFLHRGGGAFLRRYREAKGWNRQQLADHAKVSRTSIRCLESGQKVSTLPGAECRPQAANLSTSRPLFTPHQSMARTSFSVGRLMANCPCSHSS